MRVVKCSGEALKRNVVWRRKSVQGQWGDVKGDEEASKGDGEALRGDGKAFNCNKVALKGDADA